MKKNCLFLLCFLILVTFGCITSEVGSVKASEKDTSSIVGNTYINSKYNCQVSKPSGWEFIIREKEGKNIYELAGMKEGHEYKDFYGILAVSHQPQESLEKYAQIGSFDAKIAKYTYIAGKKTFYASGQKKSKTSDRPLTIQIYKFVNKGIGYIFSLAYLSQWDADEKLQEQIEYILNSFAFLDEKGIIQETAGGRNIKDEKLLNVAMLDMIDMRNNSPSKLTEVLTNELQNKLSNTGKVQFVERRKLKNIVDEHKFQKTGMVSDKSSVHIGQLTGAKYVIDSSLGVLDETSVIYVQVTDTENGNIITSVSTRCRKCSDDNLLQAILPLASKLVSSK